MLMLKNAVVSHCNRILNKFEMVLKIFFFDD